MSDEHTLYTVIVRWDKYPADRHTNLDYQESKVIEKTYSIIKGVKSTEIEKQYQGRIN